VNLESYLKRQKHHKSDPNGNISRLLKSYGSFGWENETFLRCNTLKSSNIGNGHLGTSMREVMSDSCAKYSLWIFLLTQLIQFTQNII